LFEKQYRIRVEADPLLPTALLLAEGGLADARTLKAQTGWFFRNEMFKLLISWDRHFKVPLKNIDTISFQLSTDGLPSAVKQLFEYPSKPEILLFGEVSLAETLENILPDVTPHPASDTREALAILVEREIDVVFLAIFPPGETTHTIPLYKTRDFFNLIRKRAPDMPFYLLTPGRNRTDPELISTFIRAGARGTISLPEDKPEAFAKEFVKIIRQAHRQNITAAFAAQHKTLSFETSTTLSSNNKQAIIHVNELRIRRTFQAENNNALLDRIEKPKEMCRLGYLSAQPVHGF
jgi:DNA-binding NarL/FixJ family response regulator